MWPDAGISESRVIRRNSLAQNNSGELPCICDVTKFTHDID